MRVVAEYRSADRRKAEMENAASQEMSRKQSAGGSARAVLSVRASLNPALLRIGGRLRHRAPNIGHKKTRR
ncbi:hypothetical protein SL267_35770 [Serratia marcescens]|nr:hypothetical protein SL267_35770 [Serratia marcescens]